MQHLAKGYASYYIFSMTKYFKDDVWKLKPDLLRDPRIIEGLALGHYNKLFIIHQLSQKRPPF